jgi:hypothetical protein
MYKVTIGDHGLFPCCGEFDFEVPNWHLKGAHSLWLHGSGFQGPLQEPSSLGGLLTFRGNRDAFDEADKCSPEY